MKQYYDIRTYKQYDRDVKLAVQAERRAELAPAMPRRSLPSPDRAIFAFGEAAPARPSMRASWRSLTRSLGDGNGLGGRG
jgi:hypothetical protein